MARQKATRNANRKSSKPGSPARKRLMGNENKLPKGVKTTAGGWVTHRGDDARQVARCSGGELNTHQVRILRALRDGKGMNRRDLAIASGPGPACGANWLNSLWDLEKKKLVAITVDNAETGHKKYWHKVAASGRRLLINAEKADAEKKMARLEAQIADLQAQLTELKKELKPRKPEKEPPSMSEYLETLRKAGAEGVSDSSPDSGGFVITGASMEPVESVPTAEEELAEIDAEIALLRELHPGFDVVATVTRKK